MNDASHFPQPMLLFGTAGRFTNVVLARLLAAGIQPAALVIPAPGRNSAPLQLLAPPSSTSGELALTNSSVQPSAIQLAWRAGLPVYALGRPNRVNTPVVAAWLVAQAPAIVAVACFPWRIPPAWLALPPLGFLNVHPSLLPAYRGPVPLFWMRRAGETTGGVTVHWMDTELDTGDLARQVEVAVPDGATGPELDAQLGSAGGDLLAETLAALAAGRQPRTTQPPGGNYQGWPTSADFRLDPAWSARHAYNFMCAAEEWGRPFALEASGQAWRIDRALDWDPTGALPTPVVEQAGGVLQVQCSPGIVTATGQAAYVPSG
jgi:methionyl-tRNA formyltransferase